MKIPELTPDNYKELLNDAHLYRELKKKLYNLAVKEFEKTKVEYQSEFKLGIHPIPIGYVGVRELVDIDIKDWELGMSNERFFWIDCDGNKSDYFNTKWDVYHSAKLNLPHKDLLTDVELDLIERFDPYFGQKKEGYPLSR